MNLADYDALSFDCYGTLIDWEAGIAAVLAPWAKDVGRVLTDEELLLAYAENEAQAERDMPDALYSAILADAFRRTGEKLGKEVTDEWAAKLGASVPDWPAFPDSTEALASLAKDYKLIILSNVHREASPAATPDWESSSTRSSPPRTSRLTSPHRTTSRPSTTHSRNWESPASVSCTWLRASSTTTCPPSATDCHRYGSTVATTPGLGRHPRAFRRVHLRSRIPDHGRVRRRRTCG